MIKSVITKRWKHCSAGWGLTGALLLFPAPSLAGTIIDPLRATVEHMMAIMQNGQPEAGGHTAERNALRNLFLDSFDVTEMAKRSLGSNWKRRTPTERSGFVRLFTDVVENTYLHVMKPHVGEKFVYLRETRDGEFAEVMAKIVCRKGPEFPISYKMRVGKETWKIYDVVIENVSLVNNYRSQFHRMLAIAPFEELVGRIQENRNKAAGNASLNEIIAYLIVAGLTAGGSDSKTAKAYDSR
jgi:phospholipid transport system substrate-binding protein